MRRSISGSAPIAAGLRGACCRGGRVRCAGWVCDGECADCAAAVSPSDPPRPRFTGLHSSSRRSVVKPCLAQSGERSVGEPRCLAPGIDHKRMHQGATAPGQTRGPHVFLDPVLVINWSDAALRLVMRKRRAEAARLGSHTAPRPLQLLHDRDWRFASHRRTLGAGRGRQIRSQPSRRLFAKGVRSKTSTSLPTSRVIKPSCSPLFSRTREETVLTALFEWSIERT